MRLKSESRRRGDDATVLTILQPKITTDFYAVTGEVRYDNVEGDGFLEMWNHFGETAAYFSRTLGITGPLGNSRAAPTGACSRSRSTPRARVRDLASWW